MNVTFDKSKDSTIEWLTPPELVKKLGTFDLDPCTPINPPFLHAKENYNMNDDGLSKKWFGRVYMNPPYGRGMEKWIEKLKIHGNGIALIFARTETKCFFNHIWDDADAILFVKGRIKFYNIEGKQKGTPGSPSVFIAYGKENADKLEQSRIEGKYIRLNQRNS
ncbi:MAG: adenine methyltransferase [Chitinophagaceae bacterium]|nr:MAG: adenine methyltransferase [Chitinophagaceae bacterium]